MTVGSNGHLTFGTVNTGFSITCLPEATATYAIGPYWGDQRTDNIAPNAGNGIFTSITGVAPNRVFNIEYRTVFFGESTATAPTQDYEVQLFEGQTSFDVIFALVTPKATVNDSALTIGVEKNNGAGQFTQVGCDPTGGQAPPASTGQRYHFTFGGACPTPTPTPTATTSPGQTPTPTPCGGGTPGPWTTAPTGPPLRYRSGGVSDGTFIYVFGGGDNVGGYLNDLWRWNPATQTWTQLANMPTAKQNIQGAYWNGKIYVPGGFAAAVHITENAIYDIATNTWTTGAPLPAPQTGTNVAFNNKIYNFGGNPGPQATTSIYDIATNTWSDRCGHACRDHLWSRGALRELCLLRGWHHHRDDERGLPLRPGGQHLDDDESAPDGAHE